MTSLYLIRHGQAVGNLERRFLGHTDNPLTPVGERQADLVAERFVSVPIHAVYASHLRRARQTAEPLARIKGLEVQVEPELAEIHFGDFENCSFEEVSEKHPEQIDAFYTAPHRYTGVGARAESLRQVCERMSGVMMRIVRENEGKNIAAFSHGCAIRTLLCACHGYPISQLYDIGPSNNTGVAHITVHENGKIMVHRMADDSHLGADSTVLARRAAGR